MTRRPSDARMRLLAAVEQGKVTRRWISRNSGPDVAVTQVAGQEANGWEVQTLLDYLADGWVKFEEGRVTILPLGRAALARYWPEWVTQQQQHT